MNDIPVVGYTELNEYTYAVLKPYLDNHSSYHNYKGLISCNKKYIAWKIHNSKKEWNAYYLCYKSDRPYYNWRELTKIKQIYECW